MEETENSYRYIILARKPLEYYLTEIEELDLEEVSFDYMNCTEVAEERVQRLSRLLHVPGSNDISLLLLLLLQLLQRKYLWLTTQFHMKVCV